MNITISFFILILVTYLPRALPLTLFNKEIHNRWLKSFLFYIPYAVLTAMTIPAILYSTRSSISGLIGGLTAFILSKANFSLIIVSVAAAIAVFITELILGLPFLAS